jgi:hypothetical protein
VSRLRRPRRVGLAVFAGYLLVSFLCVGLPALIRGGHRYIGYAYDPEVFVWSFAWWPHAILHGLNPFETKVIWSPYGLNTMWSTTVPGLAIAFAPLTLLFGPVFAVDVAAVLLPALAAYTGFALCRYLTGSFWPSVAGGWFFGFSSYMVTEDMAGGHLNLACVFLLPLIPLLVLRYLDGKLDGRGLVIRLGPALAFEILVSTEVTFTLAVALAISLVTAFLVAPARRRRLVAIVPPLVLSYAVAAVLTAPFVYYTLRDYNHPGYNGPDFLVANLGNFLVPKTIVAAGGWLFRRWSQHFGGAGPYIGLPALVIVVLFARESWRRPSGRFILPLIVLSIVASLGWKATLGRRHLFWAPWSLVQNEPLFGHVLTGRLVVYTFLLIAVVIALWAANRRPGTLRWLLPVLALASIFPNPANMFFSTRYDVPAFFTASAYRDCLDPGETVLPLPIRGGIGLLWQTSRDFRWKMAGGDIGPDIPFPFVESDTDTVTGGGDLGPAQVDDTRAFIQKMGVTSVVVDGTQASRFRGALDRIATPHKVGGVYLYHLTRYPPPCP